MVTNVDGLDVNVHFDKRFYMTYNYHYIAWHQFPLGNGKYSGVQLECICCGEETAINGGSFDERESWIAIMYLLDDFDYYCGTTLDEALNTKMNDRLSKYLGRPKDASTITELENDIQDALGTNVPVDIH